jgi:hypothetical protein
MLVESIVRKTLGLKRHCVKKVKEKDGHLMVFLSPDKRFKLICSHCGSKGPGYDTLKVRRWKHVHLWGVSPLSLFTHLEESSVQTAALKLKPSLGAKGKAHFPFP